MDMKPNYGREAAFSWDTYFDVPDPDALAAELHRETSSSLNH
jgi:hypothetical protein